MKNTNHTTKKKNAPDKNVCAYVIEEVERLHCLLENAADGIIFVNNQGIICEANEVLCKMISLTKEQLIGKHSAVLAKKLLKGKDLTKVLKSYKRMFAGKTIAPYELEFNHRILEIHSPATPGDKGYTVIFHDKTEQKIVHQREMETAKKYRKIFENASDGMIYFNIQGEILDINSHALKTLGVSRSKILNKHLRELTFLPQKDIDLIENQFQRSLKKDKVIMNLDLHNRNGREIRLECVSNRIMHNSKIDGVLVIARDVTERLHQEALIQASLKEKEILLQEVHHRVKNNLQIISSLLHLQSFQFTEGKILDCIKQSQNRIRAMAVLHEQLYQAADFVHIDLEHYFRTLIRHLLNQFSPIANRVRIQLEVEKKIVCIENAVYCGLIINELISNSLKYAFPNNRSGHVIIRLHAANHDKAELFYQDDGVGLPQALDVRKTQTLGLRLVRLLSEDQMRGSLTFEKSPKTTFTIVFDRNNQ